MKALSTDEQNIAYLEAKAREPQAPAPDLSWIGQYRFEKVNSHEATDRLPAHEMRHESLRY